MTPDSNLSLHLQPPTSASSSAATTPHSKPTKGEPVDANGDAVNSDVTGPVKQVNHNGASASSTEVKAEAKGEGNGEGP